ASRLRPRRAVDVDVAVGHTGVQRGGVGDLGDLDGVALALQDVLPEVRGAAPVRPGRDDAQGDRAALATGGLALGVVLGLLVVGVASVRGVVAGVVTVGAAGGQGQRKKPGDGSGAHKCRMTLHQEILLVWSAVGPLADRAADSSPAVTALGPATPSPSGHRFLRLLRPPAPRWRPGGRGAVAGARNRPRRPRR